MKVDHVSDAEVIVVGGGAAGLMCAALAAQRGKRVLVLEHQERIGKKILISGGGRCNFTNLQAGPENYLSAQPDFCRSALARYTPQDFLQLVHQHGISYYEKKLGQQFCTGSSREIVEMLRKEGDAARVKVMTGCHVQEVKEVSEPDGTRFLVKTQRGTGKCRSLVVATGGLSFPQLGASDFGYRVARQFGLKVTPLRPGLVPLTFSSPERDIWRELSGISLPVQVTNPQRGPTFQENLLFTHHGLSGPAILQISSYWREGEGLEIDLIPGEEVSEWMGRQPTGDTPEKLVARHLPSRFARTWAQELPARPLAQLSVLDREKIARALKAWPISCAGTEGYAKAEVTLGGIATGELSSKTLEARRKPGLFFIGEVVDVTGWLGGYNFQWAWSSASAAAQAV